MACFVPDSYRDYSLIGFAKAKADGDGFFGTGIGEIFKIWNADDADLLWQNADGDEFAKAKADDDGFLGTGIGEILGILEILIGGGIFEIWNADDADLTDGRGFFFV